jgi:glycosyltransferase involved in cell wall biosynthesis
LAQASDVVHAGTGHLWQPFAYLGFTAACRAGVTTVFVQDGDVVQRIQDLTHGKSWKVRAKGSAYSSLYYRRVKRAVAHADLSLLKGQALHRRYGVFAKNAKDFYDTSYSVGDIILPSDLRAKCEALLEGQEIRCLVLGRLIDFKGVGHSIRAAARAANSGARISLDIIGDGPDRGRLVELVRSLDAEPFIRFLGSRPYSPQLLREVASYHLLLFTSLAEETPRSIFDAMAGGCALLAYELRYTQQVIDQFGHGLCVPRADVCELARRLREFDRRRPHLISLIRKAAKSSVAHSAEKWYERRAQWTIEAYERRQQHRKCFGFLGSRGDGKRTLLNSAGRNLRHPL